MTLWTEDGRRTARRIGLEERLMPNFEAGHVHVYVGPELRQLTAEELEHPENLGPIEVRVSEFVPPGTAIMARPPEFLGEARDFTFAPAEETPGIIEEVHQMSQTFADELARLQEDLNQVTRAMAMAIGVTTEQMIRLLTAITRPEPIESFPPIAEGMYRSPDSFALGDEPGIDAYSGPVSVDIDTCWREDCYEPVAHDDDVGLCEDCKTELKEM